MSCQESNIAVNYLLILTLFAAVKLKDMAHGRIPITIRFFSSISDTDECTDDAGVECVGCLGRDGLCHPKRSQDTCISVGAKWCPGVLRLKTLF